MKSVKYIIGSIVYVALSVTLLATPATGVAQTPPPPSISVLLYYDGSPQFAMAHTEALAGFATDPDYLPVSETSDPAEFTAMLSQDANSDCNTFSHSYDVFFAITADGVTATSWNALAGLVGFNSNYASIYLDPNVGTITGHVVTHMSIPNVDPVPSGAPPCFFPSQRDITSEILPPTGGPIVFGESSGSTNSFSQAPVTEGGSGGGNIIPFGDWIKSFEDWIQRNIDKVRAKFAAFLDDIATFIDGLGPEVRVDYTIEFQIAGPVPYQNTFIHQTITFHDIPASKVAELTRKFKDMVKPGQ